MLAYPLVISDFDGTLCRKDKTIGAYTRDVLRAHLAAGGIFTVATGRMFEGILSQWDKLGIDDDLPVISYQGALIRTARTRRTLYSATLERETAVRIIESCRARGLDAQTYFGGKVVVERRFEALEQYLRVNAVSCAPAADLAAFVRAHDVRKILVHLPEAEFEPIRANLDAEFRLACKVCRSSRTYLEFFPFAAGKDVAGRFLAEFYGIPLTKTLAFGDQYNDLDLLRAAGRGVAVANAVTALREAADEVAGSNEEEGVARAIAKLNGLSVPACQNRNEL